MRNKVIGQREGKAAIEALRVLHKPEELSPFEQGYLEILRRAYGQMDKSSALEPKRRQPKR